MREYSNSGAGAGSKSGAAIEGFSRPQNELWARADEDRRQPGNDRRRNPERRDGWRDSVPGLACIAARPPVSVRPVELVTAESLRPRIPRGMLVDIRV